MGVAICEGLICQVDPVPVTPLAECLAHIAGRWSFELRGYGSAKWLKKRNELRALKALFTSEYPILLEHECEVR